MSFRGHGVRIGGGRAAWIRVVLLALLLATPLHAQSEGQASTAEGALFLLLPVGAKAVGLARSMTAQTGPESVWWNPAGAEVVSGRRFVAYRGDHPVAGDATAASVLLGRAQLGTVGFSYQLLDAGSQEVTDASGNVVGTLTPRNHLGVLTLATRLGGRVGLGVNAKVAQFRFSCRGQCLDGGVSTTSLAFDAGVQVSGLIGHPLRLGAMIAHAGSTVGGEEDPLPTRLRLAASYEVLDRLLATEDLTLTVSAELEDRWRRPGSPAKYLGAEFTAGRGDVLYVRAGYLFGSERQLDGAAVGVGLVYERLELGLAKSLATSGLRGESEPVHISLGLSF